MEIGLKKKSNIHPSMNDANGNRMTIHLLLWIPNFQQRNLKIYRSYKKKLQLRLITDVTGVTTRI